MNRKQKEIRQKIERNQIEKGQKWIEYEQIIDRKRIDTGQKQDEKLIEHGQ